MSIRDLHNQFHHPKCPLGQLNKMAEKVTEKYIVNRNYRIFFFAHSDCFDYLCCEG